MRNRRNYYRLLQVQPDAQPEVIRASFRTMMRELRRHPDLGGDTEGAALLSEAYATLSHATLRAEYDKKLFSRQTRKSVTFPAGARPKLSRKFCPLCKTPAAPSAAPIGICPLCRSPLPIRGDCNEKAVPQRALARIKRNDPIWYFSSWPQEPQEARMMDISPKGMRFLCRSALTAGLVLKIDGLGFCASARVTNLGIVKSGGEKMYAVGVAFLATEFENSKGSFLSTTV